MKSDRQTPVVIVGAGFSGTMVAAQMARRGIASILLEGNGRAGRGVAYSTTEAAHLLNVRADGMSAWPEDPGHFERAFAAVGGHPEDFAERRFFGRYVAAILDEGVASGLVTLVPAGAVSAVRRGDGWAVGLENGNNLEATALILATGNEVPENLRFPGSETAINNPWGAEAAQAVADLAAAHQPVLILGTGLTMVDLVLSLDAAGHRGRIIALSRRGLIPRAHADFDPAPVEAIEVPHGNLLTLWRWMRRRSGQTGWRAAIDALRPHSQDLWQSLGADQQRRFLRHARPWWDVHRHRIAPQVAARLAQLVGEGRLEIVAGRVEAIAPATGGVEVRIRRRGTTQSARRAVGHVFNCTGPLGAIGRTRNPLLRKLLDDGVARSDHLGLALSVDECSRVEGAERLWALGPLTKGRYWEVVAVPDIRVQAAVVADDIKRELEQ